MKRDKIIYYVVTGLFSVMMLMSAGMYIFNNEAVQETFINLGHPTYIIYPLAALKVLGLVAIWTRASARLKEWAYAGYFFNAVLAGAGHLSVGDGEAGGAIIAIVLLFTSYFMDKRVFGKSLV